MARWSDRKLELVRAHRAQLRIAVACLTVLLFAAIPFFDSVRAAIVMGTALALFLTAVRGFRIIFAKFSAWLESSQKTFDPYFSLLPLPLPAAIRSKALCLRIQPSDFHRNLGAALRALLLAPSFPRTRLA